MFGVNNDDDFPALGGKPLVAVRECNLFPQFNLQLALRHQET
jgi:hypothetical protein